MNSLVLAGGYATRLHPMTIEAPKPLLPIAGRPVISYLLEKLEEFHEQQGGLCYITTNEKYETDLHNFLDNERLKFCRLLVENSNSDDNKFGPIGAIVNTLETQNIIYQNGLLVTAGDCISSLDYLAMFDYYKLSPDSIAGLYDVKDRSKVKGRYGVAILDSEGNISHFEEKPNKPSSSLVNTTNYIFNKDDLDMLLSYVNSNGGPKECQECIEVLLDNPNNNIKGFNFEGYWFDIGTFESYNEANKFIRTKINEQQQNN